MLQWIANSVTRLSRRFRRSPRETWELVQTFTDTDMRVDVREHRTAGGRLGFSIRVSFRLDEADEWIEIANLRDFNVQRVIDHLQEATKFVGTRAGCRQLPRVSIEGKRFFFDERLRELRCVDDPGERWTLQKV